MKKSILGIIAIAGIVLSSCSSDDNNTITPSSTFQLITDDLQGDINDGKVELNASETYTLTGPLVVKSGAELTIPAGTTIKSSEEGTATAIYIAVERGAIINVNGQANNPVVMTSGKANPAQSDWGGLIICGDAPVNTGSNGDSEVGNLAYGGDNSEDSSGSITFLRIEYTGAKFSSEKEFNGISFFGVGSGTTVSNIYAFESGDDGLEFFGGTVNASNLAIVNSYDDSLDFADGFAGTITNVYISGVTKAAIEGSNNGDNDVAEPMTDATINNVTITKGDDSFTASEQVINFKEGGGKQAYSNVYVDDSMTTAFKIDSGSGATARIAAGDFNITNYYFAGDANQENVFVGDSNDTVTGAGNGGAEPTWATAIK